MASPWYLHEHEGCDLLELDGDDGNVTGNRARVVIARADAKDGLVLEKP